MKKFALGIGFAAALVLSAAADVSKEDIKKLVAAGISDDVILTYVRANGPVDKLSPDDVIELKEAGASQVVLSAVIAKKPAPAPVPAPQPKVVERVVERKVYVPRSTYVYDSPTYLYSGSSTYCSSHLLYDSCVTYSPRYSYRTYYPRYSFSSYRYSPSYYRSYYGYGRSSCYPRSGISLSWGW